MYELYLRKIYIILGKGMRKGPGLHVLDALFIAGEDVRNFDLKVRNAMLRTFVQAMAKPSLPDHITMRVKDLFGLEHLNQHCYSTLSLRPVKGYQGPKLTAKVHEERIDLPTGEVKTVIKYIIPSAVMMFPVVKAPYLIAFSKSKQRKYWFNFTNQESSYECPPNALVDTKNSLERR